MFRSIFINTIFFIMITTALYPQQSGEGRLAELINEAVINNPRLLAAEKQQAAIEQQVSQAGALPDPSIGIGVMNLPVNSLDFNQEPMTGKKISLMQMFPFPGKLGLKTDIAEYQAQIVEQQVVELKNNLIKNVKKAFYQLYLTEKSIDVVAKNKALIQQLVNVAQKRYSVGTGLQQDVLKAQLELSKMLEKEIELKQMYEQQLYHFNRLLNRPADADLEPITDIRKSEWTLTKTKLKELALENRPLIKGGRTAVARAEAGRRLSQKGYLPDFSLGVAYTQRDDLQSGMKMYDFFSAEMSISIPLYAHKKQSKKVQEMEMMHAAAEQRLTDLKNDVLLQIDNAFTRLQKDDRLLSLYNTGIIPQATQTLNASLSAYRVDEVDFLTLLTSQMALFNYELEYFRILTDHESAAAELEAAVGIEFIFSGVKK